MAFGRAGGARASASLLLGRELQPEHTPGTIYFPQARRQKCPSLSEPWFLRRQASRGKHRDCGQRLPRKLVGGQSGVKSISGAWSQQAEKGAGHLDLSSKARQMQRPPWGSGSDRPCNLEKPHSFVLSQHQGLMQPACPVPAPRGLGCRGTNELPWPFPSKLSPRHSKCWWLKDQEQHQRKGSYLGTSLLL